MGPPSLVVNMTSSRNHIQGKSRERVCESRAKEKNGKERGSEESYHVETHIGEMRREMQSLMRETTHAAASQNARLLLRIREDKKAELKERNRPGKGHRRFRHHERSKETQFA